MAQDDGVSRRVALGVSFSEPRDEDVGQRPRKARGPGPYLARSGSVYLFQIRLPKVLGGGRGSRPIRISLGARPASEARRVAAILAARARLCFERMRMEQDDAEEGDKGEDRADGGSGDGGRTSSEALAEIRGELNMLARIVSQPPSPMTPEELKRAEAWRGLVDISREIAKGEDGSRLVRDNVDILKQPYVKRLMSTVSPVASTEQEVAPGAVAQSLPLPQAGLHPNFEIQAAQVVSQEHSANAAGRPAIGGPEGEAGSDADDLVPCYDLDRRFVPRRRSTRPTFSQMTERYLAAYATRAGTKNKDLQIARMRCDLFAELIGDHPVDTYNGTDLQAYINLLKFWPGDNNKRPKDMSAREIIDMNRDLHLAPLAMNSLTDGYISVVKRVIRWDMTKLEYSDPFAGVRLFYPATAAPPKPAQPLSAEKISSIFREGVASGLMDEAMMPLLGQLTGRRLGLLTHLTGNDIREKYPGVFVAQTEGIVLIDGQWARVPYKTQASTTFFVLHDFLNQIGFLEWAMARGDEFLFPQLMSLKDPSKEASRNMRKLFERAGVESGKGEVFHSLRGGQIEDMRDAKVNPRDSRLQAGHAVGDDEHNRYGFMSLTEARARELARLELNPEIDYSVYQGLDFDALHSARRTLGRKRKDGS